MWNEPVRRAGVVLLLGGVGGTRKTGEVALGLKRPVLPIADSGGDAKDFYLEMSRHWGELGWMGRGTSVPLRFTSTNLRV
jgi:hypothetical protein